MCSTLVNKGLRHHNKVRLFLASQIANWWWKQLNSLHRKNMVPMTNKNKCLEGEKNILPVIYQQSVQYRPPRLCRSASLVLQQGRRSSVLSQSWEHVNASHGLRLMWSFTTPPFPDYGTLTLLPFISVSCDFQNDEINNQRLMTLQSAENRFSFFG